MPGSPSELDAVGALQVLDMACGVPRGFTSEAPGLACSTRSPTRTPTVPASTSEYSSSREWLWGFTRVFAGISTSSTARLPPESALATL
jgi:hypothetical protein